VFRNGVTIGNALTWVELRGDGTYDVTSSFNFVKFKLAVGALDVNVNRMDSTYRVTRLGELREINVDIRAEVGLNKLPGQLLHGQLVQIHVDGAVQDAQFTPHWNVQSPLGSLKTDTEPVEISANHSMLSPMQPWNRLLNVQPNQSWRIQLFDPLTDSVTASLSQFLPFMKLPTAPPTLQAGVLEETQDWRWNDRDEPCWVIEYQGEITGRTWVRRSDGLVLRQEVIRNEGKETEEKLALEREPK
jgi:hypothetical protein